MSFRVEGMKEMRKTLLSLKIDDKEKMKIVERSLRAGVTVVRKKVKKNAPGTRIAKSFRARTGKNFNKPTIEFFMGGRVAPHAHLVEFGTAAHVIKIDKKQVLSDGSSAYGRVVHHPGTNERPFFRPAVQYSAQEAGNKFKQKLSKELDKVIRKNRHR